MQSFLIIATREVMGAGIKKKMFWRNGPSYFSAFGPSLFLVSYILITWVWAGALVLSVAHTYPVVWPSQPPVLADEFHWSVYCWLLLLHQHKTLLSWKGSPDVKLLLVPIIFLLTRIWSELFKCIIYYAGLNGNNLRHCHVIMEVMTVVDVSWRCWL